MKIPQNKNYDGLTSHYQCTYPNGRVIENTYNNLHQAELVKSDIRGSSALETVADYDYLYDSGSDKRPLLSKMTYDSDTKVSVDFAYDELGRSTKKAWLTSVGTGSTVVGFENTYDLYDSAQRFTKYERGTIGGTPGFTQGYTLDDIGNWTSFDNNGSTESRSYSSTNELTTQGTHSLAYDDNGNSLDSKNHKYIWDELNRLIEVQDNASNTVVTYYYDVHNSRVLKDFGATDEVRYYYCGNKVIEERDENEVLEREYIMGKQYADEVLVYIDHTGGSATNYFYMTDLRFSCYAIIDGLGNLIERYKYNGYGEQVVMNSSFSVQESSVVDQFYGYTGRRLDDETGLMYFRARYYDVDQGRFINRDPLGYVDGMGLYNGYFAPRGVDPSGNEVTQMVSDEPVSLVGKKPKEWTQRQRDLFALNTSALGITVVKKFGKAVNSGCLDKKLIVNGGNKTSIIVFLESGDSLTTLEHEKMHQKLHTKNWNNMASLLNLLVAIQNTFDCCCSEADRYARRIIFYYDWKDQMENAKLHTVLYGVGGAHTLFDDQGIPFGKSSQKTYDNIVAEYDEAVIGERISKKLMEDAGKKFLDCINKIANQ